MEVAFLVSTANAIYRSFVQLEGKGYLWSPPYFLMNLVVLGTIELALIPIWLLIRVIWTGLEGVMGTSPGLVEIVSLNGTGQVNSSSSF